MTRRNSQLARRVFDFPQGHNVSPVQENTQKIQSCCVWDCERVVYVCLYERLTTSIFFTEKENQKIHMQPVITPFT